MKRVVVIAVGIVLSTSLAASAQENRSEISFQGTGLFTTSTTGNGTSYGATESGGFLGTYRYHLNHWISVEGAYGYSVNTQKYALSSGAFRIQSGIHDFTGSLVVNLPSHRHSRINPYLLAGGGALRFAPTSDQVQYAVGRSGANQGSVRIRGWSQLRDLQGPVAPRGVSRARLQYSRLRIWSARHECSHSHGSAKCWA